MKITPLLYVLNNEIMQEILKKELLKLQKKLKKDHEEIQDIFMGWKISTTTQETIEKWKREKEYLKKHNLPSCSEAIDYAVELKLAQEELSTIMYCNK